MIWTPWTRRAALAAMACGAATLPSVGGLAQEAASSLRIVVIAGEDAVNIIQQRTAVAPLVEVRDRNDNPVAGALVTFSIQGGQNATFGGGLQSVIVTTNAAGRAAVTGFTPTASGAVQINVAATFQGQAATATITQTNVATAAQAAAASGGASTSSGAGGGSGGGFPTGLVAAAAGGAAGVVFLATQTELLGDKNSPPQICGTTPLNIRGFVDVTPFTSTAIGCDKDGDPVTYAWDFGDGTTASTEAVSHIYNSTGTFTVSVVVSDGKATSQPNTITVTIVSLTGRWRVLATNDVFDFVQAASRVTGTYTFSSGAGTGTLSGTLQSPFANLTLSLAGPNAGALSGIASGGVDSFNVNITGGGYPPPFVSTTLVRQ